MEAFKVAIGVALMLLGEWSFFFNGTMNNCDSLSDKITGFTLIFFAIYFFIL